MGFVFIVDSLSEENEFYIFRDDLTEVKCKITVNKTIKPYKYKLTPVEVKAIIDRYFSKSVIKNK